MERGRIHATTVAMLSLLAACASAPSNPTVQARSTQRTERHGFSVDRTIPAERVQYYDKANLVFLRSSLAALSDEALERIGHEVCLAGTVIAFDQPHATQRVSDRQRFLHWPVLVFRVRCTGHGVVHGIDPSLSVEQANVTFAQQLDGWQYTRSDQGRWTLTNAVELTDQNGRVGFARMVHRYVPPDPRVREIEALLAQPPEPPAFVCDPLEQESGLDGWALSGAGGDTLLEVEGVLSHAEATLAQARAELEAGKCKVAARRLAILHNYAEHARRDGANATRAGTLVSIERGLQNADNPVGYAHYPADEFMQNAVYWLCDARKLDPQLYQRAIELRVLSRLQRHAVSVVETGANEPCKESRAMRDAMEAMLL